MPLEEWRNRTHGVSRTRSGGNWISWSDQSRRFLEELLGFCRPTSLGRWSWGPTTASLRVFRFYSRYTVSPLYGPALRNYLQTRSSDESFFEKKEHQIPFEVFSSKFSINARNFNSPLRFQQFDIEIKDGRRTLKDPLHATPVGGLRITTRLSVVYRSCTTTASSRPLHFFSHYRSLPYTCQPKKLLQTCDRRIVL